VKRATTTGCGKYSHPEISVAYDPDQVLDSDVNWLLEWLEAEVAVGRKFFPDETIQLGWMVMKIAAFRDGILKVCEPDMKTFPARFIDSVTNTLSHLRFQKMTSESIGVENELVFSSLTDSAITCTWFGEHTGVFMNRLSPNDSDSGWFIGCDDKNHDHQDSNNLLLKSVYELVVVYEQSIIPYLALPPGISVHVCNGIPILHRKDKELAIRPNSYLAALLLRK
jgi:hypothetical protein